MFCTNCGNPLRDGAVFCPQCGARTAPIEASASADAELNELLARADLLVAEEAAQTATPQSVPVAPPVPDPIPAAAAPQSVPSAPPVIPAPQPVSYAPPVAAAPPKKKSRTGLIVLAVILAALLMAAAAFFSWKFFLADDDRGSTSQNDSKSDRDDDAEDKDADPGTDPDADEDAEPSGDADADADADEAPTQDEGSDAAGTPAAPETPAEPEGPSEEELMAEAEACIIAGQYIEALTILSQIEESSDPEYRDELFTAAALEPSLASVDVSNFPTIEVELHYNSTLYFSNEVILTEDGVPLSINAAEYDDAAGIAVFTCIAAPGENRSLDRTIGIQIVYDAFELTAETIYQTPALVSRYELFFADVSWEEAVAECEAMGGHLITITSGDEMGIAVDLARDNDALYTWIGGYTTVSSDGVTAHWITGEPMDYQLWAIGEPSGADRDGTVENCMMLWNVPSLGGWSWNDQRPDPVGDGFYAGEIAFICEWEEYES